MLGVVRVWAGDKENVGAYKQFGESVLFTKPFNNNLFLSHHVKLENMIFRFLHHH